MKGNPFFVQERPGRNETIFKLIKFRTMTNVKDDQGNLLPDNERNSRYGNFLRKTSLDELGELLNIIKGDMSIIGPRPLLVRYLPYYTENERHRHDVRPGLTGWAQINGRNFITWEEIFSLDVFYVNHLSFTLDLKIIFMTLLLCFSLINYDFSYVNAAENKNVQYSATTILNTKIFSNDEFGITLEIPEEFEKVKRDLKEGELLLAKSNFDASLLSIDAFK